MKTSYALAAAAMLLLATLAYTGLLYPELPDRFPVHWNLAGQIDKWGEKGWALWLLPATMLMFFAFIPLLPAMSTPEDGVEAFLPTFNQLMVVVIAMFGYVQLIALEQALHPHFDAIRWLASGLFLCLALLGNMLGKVRKNRWIGVRTPWTLASDTVWIATHRLAARLLAGAGVVGAVAIWLGTPIPVAMALLLAAVLIPVVESYVLYRRLEREGRT